jgi:hypothetical protein
MGIFDAIGKINSGILGLGGRGGGKGKIKQRVSKLENQIQAIQSRENQGPTPVDQPIDIQPETQLGVVPQAFDGSAQEELELLPNNPTVASPFSPGAQQAAGGMFGNPMPGSFDRSMDQEQEIY